MEVLILQGFGKNVFTDPELADEAALIVECLTDNLLIPTPSPSGAAIQTVLTAYNLSRVQVRITRIGSAAAKDAERDALEEILGTSARDVQTNYSTSRSMALSSGHRIKRSSHPIGRLATPEYFNLANTTNTGEVFEKTPAIPYAEKYLFENTQTLPGSPGCVIVNGFSNSPHFLSVGNTPGLPLWGRVTPLGSDKTLSPSAWFKLDLVT